VEGFAVFAQGSNLARYLPWRASSLTAAIWQDALMVVAIGLVSVALLGRRMEARKQSEGETAVRRWIRGTFFQPLFWKEAFKRAMRRRLDRNPLIWLEHRTAWKRSGRWSLVGILMVIESYLMLAGKGAEFLEMQLWVGFVLLVLLAISSAGSFNQEIESGAFELLLVAPMTEHELVRRRLQAVGSFYLPVGLVLLFFAAWPQMLGLRANELGGSHAVYSISLLMSTVTIPVVGLYWALTRRNFLAILAGTISIGLLGPLFLWDLLWGFLLHGGSVWPSAARGGAFFSEAESAADIAVCFHLGLIGWFYSSAVNTLKERQFRF
jgi:hypothetical protein